MKLAAYTTPQEAEAAFYEAFQSADLEAMMGVWADDEDIVCVHPNGARQVGVDAVRESWRRIFASGQRLRFRLEEAHHLQTMVLSVHCVIEHIAVQGDDRPSAKVIATNVFQRSARGWRMVVHHASPAPAAGGRETRGVTKTLH
jgi:ketosteroid isomerase-like protein